MEMQIFVYELNHFSGLHTKHSVFINKDVTVIALVDFGPRKISITIPSLIDLQAQSSTCCLYSNWKACSLRHHHLVRDNRLPSVKEFDTTLDEHLCSI